MIEDNIREEIARLKQEEETIQEELQEIQNLADETRKRLLKNNREARLWKNAAQTYFTQNGQETPEWARSNRTRVNITIPRYPRTVTQVIRDIARKNQGIVHNMAVAQILEEQGRENSKVKAYSALERLVARGQAQKNGPGNYRVDILEERRVERKDNRYPQTIEEAILASLMPAEQTVETRALAALPNIVDRPSAQSQVSAAMGKMVKEGRAVKVGPGLYRVNPRDWEKDQGESIP